MKTRNSALQQWVVLCLVSVVLFMAGCSPNNVKTDSGLQKYFDQYKVSGTFGLYDNGTGQFTIYNLARFKDTSYLPASTFEIVHSLVGIETGRIVNEKMIFPWDGHIHFYPNDDTAKAWNKDLTVEDAFRASSVPVFQEIARRIGKDTLQQWLDSLKYGNHIIKTRIDSFWLDNSLKITPDEELGLVKRLYFNQLPFQKRSQDIVKKMMLQENNANYRLSYKSGWGFLENGKALGWMVGWIEENRHPYFFVLNIEAPHATNMAPLSLDMLKAILKEQDFFEGKR